MKIKHGEYLEYEIPDDWEVKKDDDCTSIFSNDGEGALTLSYYSIIDMQQSLDEHISIMAKKFVDTNRIKLKHALILDGTKKEKKVLYGEGSTTDNWYIKLWIIAKYPKVIFASYQSKKKTSEIKKVDKIIASFTLTVV